MKASRIGQFEQSFMFHMIRDFFLLLLVVVALELGIRYGVVLYEFKNSEPERVDRSAQQLAADVKSIMLNSGGPTAAQTVYPILKRNYDDLGLAIAVVPAEVTVESMKLSHNMVPQGLRANWPVGNHNEASVTLSAEQFCLNCHVKARVGDVLGTVLETQLVVARESGAFNELLQSLDEVAATGHLPAAAVKPLRGQLGRLRDSFGAVAQALKAVAPPVVLADAQTAEYQAFAQSLREMALLEATMQAVAESGQRVLHRLAEGRQGKS